MKGIIKNVMATVLFVCLVTLSLTSLSDWFIKPIINMNKEKQRSEAIDKYHDERMKSILGPGWKRAIMPYYLEYGEPVPEGQGSKHPNCVCKCNENVAWTE